MFGEAMISRIIEFYTNILNSVPSWAQTSINLFLVVLLVLFYAFFIWKLYTSISKKNIFGLGLGKYNKSENEFFAKVFGGLLYLAEYTVILPFVIFFWFTIFSLFLIVLTENLNVAQVLTLSVVIVAAIRITAYFKKELSKDLAKLIPLTLLGVSLVNPGFFNFERILSHLGEIPSFFNQVFIYLAFITTIEILLRFIDFILSLFGKSEKINFGNWEEESEGEEEKDN